MPEIDRSTVAYTDALAELVQQRLEILQQWVALQSAWDEAQVGQPDGMMSLLAKRQALLDALLATEERLVPYREDDPETRRWRSPDARRACREKLEAGQRLLRSIVDGDQRLIERLSAARDAVAGQLQQTADVSHVQRAYSASEGLELGTLDITE
ncbi:MAG: hypothetical protein D6753_10720 [Planctomycetota bacterium]|nr:MAG: hypothetical protein D6753_10720 [Planctomycetota bacterium]